MRRSWQMTTKWMVWTLPLWVSTAVSLSLTIENAGKTLLSLFATSIMKIVTLKPDTNGWWSLFSKCSLLVWFSRACRCGELVPGNVVWFCFGINLPECGLAIIAIHFNTSNCFKKLAFWETDMPRPMTSVHHCISYSIPEIRRLSRLYRYLKAVKQILVRFSLYILTFFATLPCGCMQVLRRIDCAAIWR